MAACGAKPFCNVYRYNSYGLSSLRASNMLMVRTRIANEGALLQTTKYSLILTYEDYEAGEWKMLMLDCVRDLLSTSLPAILSIVEKTGKAPKYKDLRMLAFLNGL